MPENLQSPASEIDIDEYLEAWNEENELSEEDGVEDTPPTEEEETPSLEEVAGDAKENEPISADKEDDEKEETDLVSESETLDGTEEHNDKESSGDRAENATEEASSEEGADEKQEGASEEARNKAFDERVSADILEIQKIYPDVKELKDVGDVKSYIALTVLAGKGAVEAYELINKGKAQGGPALHTEKEVNASKAHLTSSVPKGASDASDVLSDRQVKEYADDLGISEKEVRKYYKRIKTQ